MSERHHQTVVFTYYSTKKASYIFQKGNETNLPPSIVRLIKSKRMRWAGHVARMGDRDVYRILVGKPEGNRPLRRPRRRWEDNINLSNAELNPICCLLALLGAHHFLHVSRIRVKLLTLRLLMSYIYMEHQFLIFLDHTQRRTTVGRTPLDE